jgi:PAS domain S-box-containing protein
MGRFARTTPPRFTSRVGRLVGTLLIVASGTATSAFMFVQARAAARREFDADLSDRADRRVELLKTQITRSLESLHAVGSLLRSRPGVSAAEFERFVADSLARQPEVQALGWSPRVLAAQRQSIERELNGELGTTRGIVEGASQATLAPAATRQEYFPVLFLEPHAANRTALGYDLASSEPRRAALTEARDSGRPVATAPLHLLQETTAELGFIVYLPVYRQGAADTVAGRRSALAGFASAVFRISRLLRSTMQDLEREGLSARVIDGPTATLLAGSKARSESRSVALRTIEVAGRQWKLALSPTEAFAMQRTHGALTALVVGLCVTALLGAYVWAMLSRTVVVEQRVAERTAELSREVAERRRAQELAGRAEANYRGIFDNSVEGIFQTTPDGHYLNANAALARIYGYDSPQQLIADLSNIAHQLYVEPGRRDEFTRQIRESGTVSDFESQVYRRDRSVIWISENARVVCDDSGSVLRYEGFVVDVTARKEAQTLQERTRQELERRVEERTGQLAASNAAKSRFLASMSHEIRTPMNAILGYAQLLERDRSLRPGQREAIATIGGSGRHLLGLIDGILDLSRIEAGHIELASSEFRLEEMARELERMFRQRCQQKSVHLVAKSCRTRVVGDEGKLRQVLINLLGNAVRFTDNGQVSLEVMRRGAVAIEFRVADTGIGIPAEAQTRIFEPFQQEHAGGDSRGGSGLGLAIAQQHVRLMGGELKVHSEVGRGTTFAFTLPLVEVADGPSVLEPIWETARLAAAAHRSVRVLVVDDVLENRQVLAEMLAAAGCQAILASCGREALSLAAATVPDAVLLDVLMPQMDGFETARRLRDLPGWGAVPIVATSASLFVQEQQRYAQAGFADVLSKPISCRRLSECLARVLRVGLEFDDRATTEDISWSPNTALREALALPAPLRAQIREAADICDVTEARACAAEVDRLCGAGGHLARCLAECLRTFDLAPLSRLLAAEGLDIEAAAVAGENA